MTKMKMKPLWHERPMPSWWNEWKRKTKQWIFCSMKNIKWKRKQEARREGFYSCLLHKTHEAHSRYFKVKIRATASFGLLVAYMDSFLDFPYYVSLFSPSLSLSIITAQVIAVMYHYFFLSIFLWINNSCIRRINIFYIIICIHQL